MTTILNSAIIDSVMLHKTLTAHLIQIWLKLMHSDSLNLMMAAILNSAILNSAILHKKTLLMHSHSTLWWQPYWILPSWIQPFCTKMIFTHAFWFNSDDGTHLEFCHHGFSHSALKLLIHSHLTWWWQPSWILPSWILPSWIQPCCTKLWLNLIQSDSNSFILTELDDGSHAILNSAILDSAMLHKTLTHLIQSSNSFILTEIDDDSHLEFYHFEFSHTKKLHSCIVTQIDDGSHLCHHGFRHLVSFSEIHSKTLSLHSDSDSNWFNLINLMMAAILNSAMLDSDTAILDSDTLLSSLRFTQKHSHSILTLTQTNSIWLKLIHSHLIWWWQQSWILTICIQPS